MTPNDVVKELEASKGRTNEYTDQKIIIIRDRATKIPILALNPSLICVRVATRNLGLETGNSNPNHIILLNLNSLEKLEPYIHSNESTRLALNFIYQNYIDLPAYCEVDVRKILKEEQHD